MFERKSSCMWSSSTYLFVWAIDWAPGKPMTPLRGSCASGILELLYWVPPVGDFCWITLLDFFARLTAWWCLRPGTGKACGARFVFGAGKILKHIGVGGFMFVCELIQLPRCFLARLWAAQWTDFEKIFGKCGAVGRKISLQSETEALFRCTSQYLWYTLLLLLGLTLTHSQPTEWSGSWTARVSLTALRQALTPPPPTDLPQHRPVGTQARLGT